MKWNRVLRVLLVLVCFVIVALLGILGITAEAQAPQEEVIIEGELILEGKSPQLRITISRPPQLGPLWLLVSENSPAAQYGNFRRWPIMSLEGDVFSKTITLGPWVYDVESHIYTSTHWGTTYEFEVFEEGYNRYWSIPVAKLSLQAPFKKAHLPFVSR